MYTWNSDKSNFHQRKQWRNKDDKSDNKMVNDDMSFLDSAENRSKDTERGAKGGTDPDKTKRQGVKVQEPRSMTTRKSNQR